MPKLIPRGDSRFVDVNHELALHCGIGTQYLILNPLPLCLAINGRALRADCECVPCSPFGPSHKARLIRQLQPRLILKLCASNPHLRYIGSGSSQLTAALLDEDGESLAKPYESSGELGEEVAATVVLRDPHLTREDRLAVSSKQLSFDKMP